MEMPTKRGELVAMGGHRKQQGRTPGDRMSLGEKVLAARNVGRTMPDICAELNLTVPTAYRYMELALSVRIPPTVDAFRTQNDRLDQTQREIQHQLDAANYVVQQAMLVDPPSIPSLMK